MEWLVNMWSQEWFRTLVVKGLFWVLVIAAFICKLIASRCKNERIKRAVSLLPEAMLAAENKGGTAEQKLNYCRDYILERVKISSADITDFIEKGIEISKSINVQSQEKQTNSYSRTTRD